MPVVPSSARGSSSACCDGATSAWRYSQHHKLTHDTPAGRTRFSQRVMVRSRSMRAIFWKRLSPESSRGSGGRTRTTTLKLFPAATTPGAISSGGLAGRGAWTSCQRSGANARKRPVSASRSSSSSERLRLSAESSARSGMSGPAGSEIRRMENGPRSRSRPAMEMAGSWRR